MELLEVQATEIIQSNSTNNTYVLMLYESHSKQNIPIMIGEYETQVILMARERVRAKRPLTHDLLCDIMEAFSLTAIKVVIEKFNEGVFYSNIFISDGISTQKIDSRTSDAIALALALRIPIYATQAVLNEVGISEDTFIHDSDDGMIDQAKKKLSIEELEQQLKILEHNEEYEKAAELLNKINKLKSENAENN